MERQRLMNQSGENQDPYIAAALSAASSSSAQGGLMGTSSVDALNASPSTSGASPYSPSSGSSSVGSFGSVSVAFGNSGTSGEELAGFEPRTKPASLEEQKAADAALSEYELYQVDDNWLDETLQERMMSFETDREQDELSIDEQTEFLLDQLEKLPDNYGDKRVDKFGDNDDKREPWDNYGMDESEKSELVGGRRIPIPEPGMYDSVSHCEGSIVSATSLLLYYANSLSHLSARFRILFGLGRTGKSRGTGKLRCRVLGTHERLPA